METRKKSLKKSKLSPDLSIVIPAYREEKRIGKTLDELARYLKTDSFFKQKNIEVIVVVADSGDKTVDIVLSKRASFKDIILLRPGPKVGKGRDVAYGMLRAKGRTVVFMDADLATPIYHLEDFYKLIEAGAEIVVGTRNLLKHHKSVLRRSISNIGNLFFVIAGGVWIEDSQCGFKMFSSGAVNICFSQLKIMGWGFDMEILAIAKANKLNIDSRRIDDWKSVPDGTFEDNILHSALRSLIELSTISFRRALRLYVTKD